MGYCVAVMKFSRNEGIKTSVRVRVRPLGAILTPRYQRKLSELREHLSLELRISPNGKNTTATSTCRRTGPTAVSVDGDHVKAAADLVGIAGAFLACFAVDFFVLSVVARVGAPTLLGVFEGREG